MVGVPGRSRACQTCKTRHIACDLQHLNSSACGPCSKSRRVCRSGQSHVFVNHDEGSHRTVYRKEARSTYPQQFTVRLRTQTVEEKTKCANASPQTSHLPSVPPVVSPRALVTQQVLANARQAVNNGDSDVAQFPQFWSSAITSQSLDSWACRTSPALACYTAWVGRQNEDPMLVQASRKLYVQGLREVQCSVNDPNMALLDETLSACIGLIVYEALECPDRSYAAYHKHIDGCSALIKLRGVDAHRNGVGNELFRGFRYIAVIKALQDRKGTYLATPVWSSEPFSAHPKDIHDRLLDVLATGANFLGESDQLATVPPSQIVPALLNINDRIVGLDTQLNSIYEELVSTSEGSLYWTAPASSRIINDPQDEAADEATFVNRPLHFPSQETARILTLYWAQQTLLRMGLSEIRNGLAALASGGMVTGHAERVNAALSRPAKPLIEPAHLVLQARDYCCSSQSAVLRYSVPLNITLDVLANKPELYATEIAFAREVKRRISERHLRITRYTSMLRGAEDAR